jgi:hypothetical protein
MKLLTLFYGDLSVIYLLTNFYKVDGFCDGNQEYKMLLLITLNEFRLFLISGYHSCYISVIGQFFSQSFCYRVEYTQVTLIIIKLVLQKQGNLHQKGYYN